MKLRYITCSDPREDIPVESILNFSEKYPMSEIGVQAHVGPMSEKKPRNIWFSELVKAAKDLRCAPNIALHVNYLWCDYMCLGKIPSELSGWVSARNKNTREPVIKRIQLNIGDWTFSFNARNLAKMIKRHSAQEFILPWNPKTANQIQELKQTGAKFSLLFDGSYGAGKEPEKWQGPVYKDIPNGYAGGLGPDNVAGNLDKINQILPENYETWIDAEGKLRDYKTTGSFTLELAEKYMQNAIAWYNQHSK